MDLREPIPQPMQLPSLSVSSKFFAAAVALTLAPPSCGDAAWQVERLPTPWAISGFANSLDLSGIAAASPTHCLVGSDESFHIQPGIIDRRNRLIRSLPSIPLPIDAGIRKPEIDIEGVAFSARDRAYYVVGSHGVGKKKGDIQPLRHSIYRIPVGTDGAVNAANIRRASLRPWLERTPELAPYVGKELQRNGLNIEGLASSGDRLFFGLRAPNKDGRALVIEACPGDLFERQARPLQVHALAIPHGRGIREIAAVSDGFIFLTGNASAEASKKIPVSMAPGPDNRFELWHWNGRDARPNRISILPDTGGKAEGLLVLDDASGYLDLLIVFDGLTDGRPLAVRVRKANQRK